MIDLDINYDLFLKYLVFKMMHQTWNDLVIDWDINYDLFSKYLMSTMMHQTWNNIMINWAVKYIKSIFHISNVHNDTSNLNKS
jgi:hypothetical protein